MKCIVEFTHKTSGQVMYMCAVPIEDDSPVPDKLKHMPIKSFENTMTDKLDVAECYPYPDEEGAIGSIGTLPETKNLDYKLLEIPAEKGE